MPQHGNIGGWDIAGNAITKRWSGIISIDAGHKKNHNKRWKC